TAVDGGPTVDIGKEPVLDESTAHNTPATPHPSPITKPNSSGSGSTPAHDAKLKDRCIESKGEATGFSRGKKSGD
ncbi:hypothetical protein PMAYCL1PPCAC_14133, partial [Pristionchus mayeri]